MMYNVCKWLHNGKMTVRVTDWTIGEVLFSGSYNECLDYCKNNKLYHWEQEDV